jgi:hypothetical protein
MKNENSSYRERKSRGPGGDTLPLGKRLRMLFKDIELREDIPELRGQLAKPVDLS